MKQNRFESILAQNGQVTVKKEVRDALNLKPGAVIWLEVKKVVSQDGNVLFDSEVKEANEVST